ncbi:unnamed protein product, partial [Polarella glacialis]
LGVGGSPSAPSSARVGVGPSARAEQSPAAVLTFVAVSKSELCEARTAALGEICSILPINLAGRKAMAEPTANVNSDWLAVLCPGDYLQEVDPGASDFKLLVVKLPVNCMPTPHIVRTVAVRVSVLTPCCGQPLQGVSLCVGGRRVGSTSADGTLEIALPPGRHVLSAPGFCSGEQLAVVEAGGPGSLDVDMPATGELFFFIQDNSHEEDVKDGLMLTGSRINIADDAGRFTGAVELGAASGQQGGRPAAVCVPPGEALRALRVVATDGRQFSKNEDLTWFDDFADECEVALLFSGLPIRLGDLVGPRQVASAPQRGLAAPAEAPVLRPRPPTVTVHRRQAKPTASRPASAQKVALLFSGSTDSNKVSAGYPTNRAARPSSAGRVVARGSSPLVVGRWCDGRLASHGNICRKQLPARYFGQ